MTDEKKQDDPGRTPGQAEGTEETAEDDKQSREQPDPGRTPGQAEGTEEDANS